MLAAFRGQAAAMPRRLSVVENIVKGSPKNADPAKLAGGSASRGATPLNYNQFKIPLLENLVMRAIRDA
jgi:xanthine dehydrogenase YagS FAD-binding subunit